MRRVLGLAVVLATSLLMVTACSDDPSGPTEASCDTAALASAEENGLAVLLSTAADGRATLYGVDAGSGDFDVACALPAEWKPADARGLTMLYQGEPFPDRPAPDVLFATQWVSPDYRWAAGPQQPLVDVAAGRVVTDRPAGDIVAVNNNQALVTRVEGDRAVWCIAPLPPSGQRCDPLPDPGAAKGYVLGVDEKPTVLSLVTSLLNLDKHTAFILTDGIRIYRAEWYRPGTELVGDSPEAPSGTPPYQVAVPAEGNAITAYSKAGIPGLVRLFDWWTPDQRQGLLIRTTGHGSDRDEKGLTERLHDDPSTHYVLGLGDHMVIGQPEEGETRFAMIYSGSERIENLDVRCPTVTCRILYWPNVIP